MRPIDHLVLPVTTLTLARSRLTSLGFNVAPDARHPFGTGNCCVFFENGTYLEPIAFVDRDAADIAAAKGLFFVKRLKRFTERRGEGFAMTALASADAEADYDAFDEAGFGAGPIYRFTRKAALPDGTEKEIGVAIAAMEAPDAADATFFACERIGAEFLFDSDQTSHPNGVRGVVGVTAVAESPADFHVLLTSATGQRELRATSFGIEAVVGPSLFSILTPDGFRARYGMDGPHLNAGPVFAALDLQVDDPTTALQFAGSGVVEMQDRFVIPPAPGLSAVVSFRKNSNV